MATSRAAWAHVLHDNQQQSGRGRDEKISGCIVSWSFLYDPATTRGVGEKSGCQGGFFVGMIDRNEIFF